MKQEADGSFTTIGCHATKQDAIDQMIVVSLSEDIEPLGQVDARSLVIHNYGTVNITQSEVEIKEEETDEEEPMTEPDESGMNYEERAPSLVAPEFMAASAERGLRLHEEGFSGDGLMPATVADARRMANGEPLSEAKWRKIPAWIARHIVDLDAVEGYEITAGLVAMLLWGGGSSKESARRAQAYAERIVAQFEAASSENNDRGIMLAATMSDPIEQRWCITGADEKRIAYTTLDLRQADDGTTLYGYAAVFDSPSEPMPFVEYVKRGAFQKTIKDGADVRLLIDHEGVPLARTKSGTLRLSEDERGLAVEAELDPMNPDAARVISAMKRGDLSQMSFAFRTIKDSWSDDRTVRELREVQLFDVSVVTFPAYEQTVAEIRSRLLQDEAQPPTLTSTSTAVSVRKAQLALARRK
ncbi:MAG: HK97 family phage prohead protease [Caulobacteraceae bacterium]|nr:HK97 family phage prohead protease [Caulobacteraceae bacterium]